MKIEILQFNRDEGAAPQADDNMPNIVHRKRNEDDCVNSSHLSQGSSGSLQNQTPVNISQASNFEQVPVIPKQETDELKHQDGGQGVSGSTEGGTIFSVKKEKASNTLHQTQSSDSTVPVPAPVPQSSQNEFTYFATPGKALEKLQPRRNPEAVVHGSRSDKRSNSCGDPANLQVCPSPDAGFQASELGREGNPISSETKKISNTLPPIQNLDSQSTPLADPEKFTYSMRPEGALEKLQPRKNPEAGVQVLVEGSGSSKTPEKYASVPVKKPDNVQPRQSKNSGHEGSDIGQEKLQPRRNPDNGVQGFPPDPGSSSARVPLLALDDGYNWRKYGQKLVKGNEFIRGYYKCTYSNCQVKKQVEKSHNGYITDINYLGKHEHPKPEHSPQSSTTLEVRRPEMPVISSGAVDECTIGHGEKVQRDEPSESSPALTALASGIGMEGAISHTKNESINHSCPDAKRQKREISVVDDNLPSRSNSESRHVVQTISEVDIVNDGYRWRKYGQKLVKGNPNPRSYYRCSTTGCPAKKHVERASHDPKVVVTTYEGKHDHDMPHSRNVNQDTAVNDTNPVSANGESRSKSDLMLS